METKFLAQHFELEEGKLQGQCASDEEI